MCFTFYKLHHGGDHKYIHNLYHKTCYPDMRSLRTSLCMSRDFLLDDMRYQKHYNDATLKFFERFDPPSYHRQKDPTSDCDKYPKDYPIGYKFVRDPCLCTRRHRRDKRSTQPPSRLYRRYVRREGHLRPRMSTRDRELCHTMSDTYRDDNDRHSMRGFTLFRCFRLCSFEVRHRLRRRRLQRFLFSSRPSRLTYKD